MERRTHELLENLAVTITDVRAEVGTMSGGQRQQVAIARSLLGEPKVVMLDEPTAALGVRQTAQVLELIQRLRERGLGVIVISHNLANVFEVADRIFVLRLGRKAGDYKVEETSHEEIVAAITGIGDGAPPATAREESDDAPNPQRPPPRAPPGEAPGAEARHRPALPPGGPGGAARAPRCWR